MGPISSLIDPPLSNRTSAQVESLGQETVDSRVFRRFHGSSIPADKSGDRIYPVPFGTDRNLSKPAAGYGYRIPASNSWHFPAGSGRLRPAPARNDEFPEGFCRQPTEYCFRNHRP